MLNVLKCSSIAAAMNIDCVPFSHQEGHIEAIKAYSELNNSNKFLACHFSQLQLQYNDSMLKPLLYLQ